MKELIISFFLLLSATTMQAQADRAERQSRAGDQDNQLTATLKSSTRLFGEEDDLTTVIMIIPSGSVVDVLGSDSAYYHVVFEDNEGFILKRHATLNLAPEKNAPVARPSGQVRNDHYQEAQPEKSQRISRFEYLERKYGSNLASRIMQGKIWLGMTAEMVKDSWGSPQKINRVISGNLVKEDWVYNNTWLHIENNILTQWGPVKGSARQ